MSNRVLTVVSAFVLTACAQRAAQQDDHTAHMNPADRAAPSTVGGADPGTAGLPASNAKAPARVAASPRHGEWVKIAWESGSSDSLMAWIVYPMTRNKAPVVVVIHEILGLSTWVRGVADQLAADGFIAIAPDLISRARGGPSSIELSGDTARRLIQGVNIAERNKGIAAAASYAMMQPSAEPRYGIVGYCWGGSTVFTHAVNGGVKGFSGGVAYYGAFPFTSGGQPATATTAAVPATIVADSIARIRVPVMLLNGSRDMRIAAQMPALDSIMKAQKKNYSGTNYEGATHGFLRAQDDPRQPPAPPPAGAPARPPRTQEDIDAERAADLAATKDAWPKTIAFLKKNLGAR